MVMNPLVSIVVTSYNQKDILPRAIDSVLSQTYNNIQIVIADDGSTDNSQDLINRYFQNFPHKIKPVLSPKNQGIPKNKNMGFRACDGDFITYLDGDDYYFPEKIEREIKVFQTDKSLDIVYSNFAYTDLSGSVYKYWKQNEVDAAKGYIFEDVFSRNFPFSTLYRNELIRAELLKKINYYDENLIAYEDWDSRIRMTKTAKVGHSDYVGAAYVDDPRGISKVEKRERLLQEMRYVMKKNLHLLNNLDSYNKFKIIKTLESLLLQKEIYYSSSSTYKLWLVLRYAIITGDFQYLGKIVNKKIKLAK